MLSCPNCASETKVSRSFDDGKTVSRVRECKRCGFKFRTTELIDSEFISLLNVIAKLYDEEMQE